MCEISCEPQPGVDSWGLHLPTDSDANEITPLEEECCVRDGPDDPCGVRCTKEFEVVDEAGLAPWRGPWIFADKY